MATLLGVPDPGGGSLGIDSRVRHGVRLGVKSQGEIAPKFRVSSTVFVLRGIGFGFHVE